MNQEGRPGSSRSRSSSPAFSVDSDCWFGSASRARTPSACPSEDEEVTYSHHFHFMVSATKSSLLRRPEAAPDKEDQEAPAKAAPKGAAASGNVAQK